MRKITAGAVKQSIILYRSVSHIPDIDQRTALKVIRSFRQSRLHAETCTYIPVSSEIFPRGHRPAMAVIPPWWPQLSLRITESGIAIGIRCNTVKVIQGTLLRK